MANMVPHKKFQQPKHYKRGNILLFAMGITVLASCLMLSYQNQANNLRNHLQRNKKQQKEKQALTLTHLAFNKLKSIATNDFIATCEKSGKLHFYNVQTEAPQDLGPIEFYFNEYKTGVVVLANEDLNHTTHCLFQENGLRKAIDECFSGIPHANQEKIKQRWKCLQTNDSLTSPLFSPLISELQIKDNSINLTLYNPFDRNLQGTIHIKIQGYENQIQTDLLTTETFSATTPKTIIKQVDIHIPKGISPINITLPENFTNIHQIKLEKLTYKDLRDGKYQVAYSKLNEPFSYTLNHQALCTSSDIRRPGKWGRKKLAPIHTSPESTINSSPELPCFETKNWLQQLNACCFLGEAGKPYRIIDNFEMEESDSIKLRDFFWNYTVADPKATAFNFNGSEQYLKKQFETMNFFSSTTEQRKTLSNILSHQPYPNAVAFLEQIKKFQDKLHLFQNLTHRTECFYIQSYCDDVKCTMTVFRIAKNSNEMLWKIQNIELITDKHP